MQTESPANYRWVARDTAYNSAGCLTVVTGQSRERLLTVIGADPRQESETPDGFVDEGMPAVAAVGLQADISAVSLIEANGYEGSRAEVLEVLSRNGVAASAFWNANDEVRFGCARKGKLVYTTELPAYESESVPPVLRTLLSMAEAEDADLVAIAVAMATTYAGVAVPDAPEVSRPSRFHPITNAVLGLPIPAGGLATARRPTPELVAATQAATPEACWRLAQWAALNAVEAAGLLDHAVVTGVIERFGGRPGPITKWSPSGWCTTT